ncbi:dTDP-4-dehydrorhamnose 3,5-epimerase [bacterium F11]|nr:dTDP-4-dehydrorhamnose 3,5-epimerase [bacterium F11]
MRFQKLKIPEVLLIEPEIFRDERGFFFESYQTQNYIRAGVPFLFVQDNHSKSLEKTLRGLHAQVEHPQGKLIRVLRGEIFDVAVDIRLGSPTFQHWVGEYLTSENNKQMYIPPGFAHGFCVLSEKAEVEYKCTDYYHPEDQITIAWNDPDIGIAWPIQNPNLSPKDKEAKPLSKLRDKLPKYPESSVA